LSFLDKEAFDKNSFFVTFAIILWPLSNLNLLCVPSSQFYYQRINEKISNNDKSGQNRLSSNWSLFRGKKLKQSKYVLIVNCIYLITYKQFMWKLPDSNSIHCRILFS
jgi:hypothetical protein